MSGYKNFAVVGAGTIGKYIVQQLLKDKAVGIVNDVVVLTREVKCPSNNCVIRDMLSTPFVVDTQASKAVEGNAKVVQVDYSNEESIKNALTGVDVVISTISMTALDVQVKIGAAAKKAGVQLFVPSEYGGISEEQSEGIFGGKANMQSQLKALGMPYAAFYTGPFADFVWMPYVS
jgi:saccharopine dehydrogenase-like NADP-dependent oxidoreductase